MGRSGDPRVFDPSHEERGEERSAGVGQARVLAPGRMHQQWRALIAPRPRRYLPLSLGWLPATPVGGKWGLTVVPVCISTPNSDAACPVLAGHPGIVFGGMPVQVLCSFSKFGCFTFYNY